MKLERLSIFMLLLLFLIITVLLSRWAQQDIDGFIGYQMNVEQMSSIIIPMYSSQNTVHKMYDNLYFDNKNGNIIEVDVNSHGNTTLQNDTTGSNISALHIVPRIGTVSTTFEIKNMTDKVPAPSTTMNNSYKSIDYTSKCKETDEYKVFMMPWKQDTFVHIMNNAANRTNIGTYMFKSNATSTYHKYINTNDGIKITGNRPDNHADNGKYVTASNYSVNRQVYQISEFIKFDIKNANLIVSANDKELTVYSRNGNKVTTLNDEQRADYAKDNLTISHAKADPQIIYDMRGQNMVLYVPTEKNTLVALICYNESSQLALRNVYRFSESGIDNGELNVAPQTTGNPLSEQLTNGENSKQQTAEPPGIDMSNYVLKTQIVPPVCPACPSCPNNQSGACTQCGGTGGSGTKSNNGVSLVNGDSIHARGSKNIVTGTVGLAKDAVSGTVGLAKDAVSGTVGLAGDAAKGTVGLAKDTVSGTVGLAKDTVSGTVGLASNIVGGALSTVGSIFGGGAGSGAGADNMGQGGGINASGGGMQPQNGANQNVSGSTTTNDPYSYYGQLPTRPSTKYMPITADFSSFGK